MNVSKLSRYRARLLSIRERTRPDINRMMNVVLDDAQAPGEHDHTVSESIDKEVVLETNEVAIHNAVTAAISRIDEGTFGICQKCGAKIPLERLDTIPYTPFCVACEQIDEQS